MKVLVVASTRPEVIKLSPVMRILEEKDIEHVFATTGQHYDRLLFQAFVKDLKLREPDYNVTIGSGTHGEQTLKSIIGLEKIMKKEKPEVVLVEGDTNSVLSAALAGVKLHIPVGHVEAGLRSYDKNMPEEVNRVLVDHCSELLFAPTEKAGLNLASEGIMPSKIFLTGNTIVDATLQNLEIAEKRNIQSGYGGKYLLLTLHRAENVDDPEKLGDMLKAVNSLGEKVVFPAHPRTVKRLKTINSKKMHNLTIIKPLGYLKFLTLLKGAKAVLTDCLHPDTLVQLSNGEIKKIKDVEREHAAAVDLNSLKVAHAKIKDKGFKRYKEALEINHEIIASPNHKFFTIKGLDIVEIKACDIKKGDFLVSASRIRIQGTSQKLKQETNFQTHYHADRDELRILRKNKKEPRILYQKLAGDGGVSNAHIEDMLYGSKNCNSQTKKAIAEGPGPEEESGKHVKRIKRCTHKAVTLPTKTSPEFCQLIGYMLGDRQSPRGDGQSPREYTIQITDKERRVLEEYKRIVKKVFGLSPKIRTDGERQRLQIHSKAITDFILKNMPEILNSPPTRDVPRSITKVPADELAAFLRGFYDAEGAVGEHSISIASTSKVLIQKIKLLLLRFGIISDYQGYQGKRSGDVNPNCILEIHHPASASLFKKHIGFTSITKTHRLLSLAEKKEPKIKSDEFPMNNYCQPHIRADTLSKVLDKIKRKNPHHPDIGRIESLIKGDISFTRVRSIRKIKTEKSFVDVFIPQTGNFIAQGYVVHNSGGVQEEAAVLRVPCFTLRTTTERPESVEAGGNIIVGVRGEDIRERISGVLRDEKRLMEMRRAENPFGDGRAGERIVDIIHEKHEKGELRIPVPDFTRGVWRRRFILVDERLEGQRVEDLRPLLEVTRIIDGDEEIFPRGEMRLKKGQIIETVEKPG